MPVLSAAVARFAAFSIRERILIVAAVMAVIYGISDLVWFSPQKSEAKRQQDRIEQQASQQASLTKAAGALASRPNLDPLAQQRREREALLIALREADAIIAKASAELRPGDVIRTLSASAPGVKLVSLKTLASQMFFEAAAPTSSKAASAPAASGSAAGTSPATAAAPVAAPATPSGTAAAATAAPRLYRHRVEVAVKGPYPAVVGYVHALEKSLAGAYWEGLRLEAKYPESTVRFTLSILSTHPEFVLE
jgi:MSHA biogenesis protein MshJ